MKVAFLNSPLVVVDPEMCGGAERVAFLEIDRLHDLGVDARYYVLGSVGKHPRVEAMYPSLPAGKAGREYYVWFCERASGFDIQHSMNAPMLALVSKHPRVILHVHNSTTLPYYDLAKENYRRCFYICCSKFIREDFLAKNPSIPEDRCLVLYNGIDTDLFSPAGRMHTPRPRVVFTGAWIHHKGIFVLLDAFMELERAGIEFEGVIAGSAFLYKTSEPVDWQAISDARVRGAAKRLSSVTIREVPSYRRMPDLYRGADLCVFPSVWQEPFGLGAVEAMSCGLPVVATKIGALPEIVDDGETGILVEPGDPKALAEAIARLIDDESQLRRMGERARSRAVDLFSIRDHVRRLVGIYSSIL